MHARTIVFDLDGTLVDTAPDLVDTLNIILEREGLPRVPYEVARNLIGGGAKVMIANGLASQRRSVTPARLDELFDEFIEHYTVHIADRSHPFPGVVSALDKLAADNCRFAVCTNKLERLSVMLLEKFGLAGRFAVICGQDTFGVKKPDPEVLRRTIVAAGGEINRAVMVGDSATDIRTARGAGVPVVVVDFGYSDKPVTEYQPDRVIGHFDELPEAIASLSDTN
jgi:phosphoglycolate phosphatase